MHPSPWRDTVRPWVPSAIVSMGAPLGRGDARRHSNGEAEAEAEAEPIPPYRGPSAARPGRAVRRVGSGTGVGGDALGLDEDGAPALGRHDAVELVPVVVRAACG